MHVADVQSASNEIFAFILFTGYYTLCSYVQVRLQCSSAKPPNKTQPAIANLTQKQRIVMLGTLLKELLPEQLGLSLRPVDSLTRLIC